MSKHPQSSEIMSGLRDRLMGALFNWRSGVCPDTGANVLVAANPFGVFVVRWKDGDKLYECMVAGEEAPPEWVDSLQEAKEFFFYNLRGMLLREFMVVYVLGMENGMNKRRGTWNEEAICSCIHDQFFNKFNPFTEENLNEMVGFYEDIRDQQAACTCETCLEYGLNEKEESSAFADVGNTVNKTLH